MSPTLSSRRSHDGLLFLMAAGSAVLLLSSQGCLASLQGSRVPTAGDSAFARLRLEEAEAQYWRVVLPQRPELAVAMGERPEALPSNTAAMSGHGGGLLLERRVGELLDIVNADALTPREYALWRALRSEISRAPERGAFTRLDMSALSRESGLLGTTLGIVRGHPINNAADIERFLFFLDGLSFWFADLRTSLEERLVGGVAAPLVVVESFSRTLQQLRDGALEDYLIRNREESDSIPDEAYELFERDQVESRRLRVLPAIDSLLAFLRSSYRSAAAAQPGLWQLPGGKEYYRFLLRAQSGLEIDPAQAQAAGLAQLRRLDSLLVVLRLRNGWNPVSVAFHDSLRALPRYRVEDLDEVVERFGARLYEATAKITADSQASGVLPASPLLIRAASGPEAVLHPDGVVLPSSRANPVTTVLLTPRWRSPAVLFELSSRVFRWGWPGRALQLARLATTDSIDFFILSHASPGYEAGWQEYAGALAGEWGLYADPLDAYAHLLHDAFNAALLVVDTGVHYFGWTYNQAMSTLAPYSLLSNAELDTLFVERIAATPGRAGVPALALREMTALRAWMRREQGAAFDVSAWHREVLAQGPLSLPILGAHLEWWSWDQRRRAAASRVTERGK